MALGVGLGLGLGRVSRNRENVWNFAFHQGYLVFEAWPEPQDLQKAASRVECLRIVTCRREDTLAGAVKALLREQPTDPMAPIPTFKMDMHPR